MPVSVGEPAPKRIAIVQSCYIPWKGYFDLMRSVDEFVLFDDTQFTRRDWRSRNRIKTANGPIWLTVPINVRGRYHQRIDEATVADAGWASRHWTTIEQAYSHAPAYPETAPAFRDAYAALADEPLLSRINRRLIEVCCAALGVRTQIRWSSEFPGTSTRSQRLLDLCVATGASTYLSGPSAASYLDVGLFREQGIEVEWMQYTGYAEYPQPFPPFIHEVSALDLIFSVGAEAPRYLEHDGAGTAT